MKQVVSAMVILCALSCAPALAQFKAGAHWGYLAGDSFLDNDTIGYGLQGGYDVTEYFGVELAGTYFNDNGLGLDIDVISVSLSLLLGSELPAGFRLYGGGGASYNVTDVGADVPNSPGLDNAPGYHLCGGLSIPLGYYFELTGEYRHSWISFDRTDHPAMENFAFDYSYDMLRASLCLRF